VPSRLTAFGFAVVGNFEEAINGWRRDAPLWQQPNEGIILAAAAGAVGVQLGGARRARGHARPLQDLQRRRPVRRGQRRGLHRRHAAAAGHLQSVVGLVWRSVVLWMLLLALLTLANIIG
jgi:adenosylcobinamide-phosphate synthase